MAFGKRVAVPVPEAAMSAFAGPSSIDANDRDREQASERARYERELKAHVTLINTRLPTGCEVIPWAQVPASVWSGANGQFLMKDCGFYPCHPLNTMLLPANQHTADALGLPIHPRFEIPAIRENCARLLDELRTASPVEQERLHKVVALALHIGRTTLGDVAYDRHTFLFGVGLGLGQRG
jgi:hypothetical protein